MGYVINMPKLEMGMTQGTLLEWHVSVGDTVEEGDTLAEIESEKTVTEVTAREDGVLWRTYVDAGETVPPSTPLGVVAAAEAEVTALESDAGVESSASASPAEEATTEVEDDDGGATTGQQTATEVTSGETRATPRARRLASEGNVTIDWISGSGPDGAVVAADVELAAADGASGSTAEETTPAVDDANQRVRATPKARRRAAETDVDLTAVDGTGPNGAVTTADLDAHVSGDADRASASSDEGPSSASASAGELTPTETQQLSGMRRTIAERLGQSYREAVHVTVTRLVDAEELLRATEVADDALAVDVSMTDVLLLAVSATLREHPAFNARFEDGVVKRYDQQNVGLAVDVDRGLVTPVLRDVGSKPLSDLTAERRALTERALTGDATTTEMRDGTFTVTNLGVFGVDSFDPVINPPEVAILGVTRLRDHPVDDGDGGVTMRRHIGFDLSFDHRIVDGADAARALGTLAGQVENPWPLLLERAGSSSPTSE